MLIKIRKKQNTILGGFFITFFLWLSIISQSGADEKSPGEFEIHRLKVFLGPDLADGLTMAEIGQRLSQYIEDLNTVFSKQTTRQFYFDPAVDITITPDKPHTGYFLGTLPETGYELWIHAVLTDNINYGTYGGFASCDISGAGVAGNLKWDKIYDPSLLTDGSDEFRQYWRQLDHIIHEFEHVFGAGSGEYYNLIRVDDTTGVDPVQNIRREAIDPYWSQHKDYFGDPLLNNIWNHILVGSPTSRDDLLDSVRFADVTVSIVNLGPRNPDTNLATLPDLSQTRIEVVEIGSGRPIPCASVTVWNVRSFPPYTHEIIAQGASDFSGGFEFSWTPYPRLAVFSNYDHLKLIKVFLEGYKPRTKWVSIYDCQAEKLLYGMDQMIIPVALLPETEFFEGDLDCDGSVDGFDLGVLAKAFGTTSDEYYYNPHADFEPDGSIDRTDLAVFAKNFGAI